MVKKAFLAAVFFCAAGLQAQTAAWQIGPFTRPSSGNPVIAPKAGVGVSRFDLGQDGSLGGAAYLQSRGHCARWQDRGALSRGGRLRGDGDRRAHVAAGDGGEHRRHPLTRLAEPVFYPAKDSQQAREWPGELRTRDWSRARRDLRADLHAVEPRHFLGGDCHLARPDALDQAWAGVSHCGGRKVCRF